MFGFGEHQQETPSVTCLCGAAMDHHGVHGIRLGGITGLVGAAAGLAFGSKEDAVNQAFEKKMECDVFICPQCLDVRLKYRKGL
jgi:hypothetical protein